LNQNNTNYNNQQGTLTQVTQTETTQKVEATPSILNQTGDIPLNTVQTTTGYIQQKSGESSLGNSTISQQTSGEKQNPKAEIPIVSKIQTSLSIEEMDDQSCALVKAELSELKSFKEKVLFLKGELSKYTIPNKYAIKLIALFTEKDQKKAVFVLIKKFLAKPEHAFQIPQKCDFEPSDDESGSDNENIKKPIMKTKTKDEDKLSKVEKIVQPVIDTPEVEVEIVSKYSEEDVDEIINKIKKIKFADKLLEELKRCVAEEGLLAEHAKKIVKSIPITQAQKQACIYLYSKLADKENLPIMLESVAYAATRKEILSEVQGK